MTEITFKQKESIKEIAQGDYLIIDNDIYLVGVCDVTKDNEDLLYCLMSLKTGNRYSKPMTYKEFKQSVSESGFKKFTGIITIEVE